MRTSYGVIWREGAAAPVTGKLELLPRALRVDGRSADGPVSREIAYDSLDGVRVGRASAERIVGGPTVIIERHGAAAITIGTVAQPSVLNEIAERLTALQLDAPRRTVVILPLRDGALEHVRALLDDGPPFDPDSVPGLERHEVFLTSHHALFLFESRAESEPLVALLAEPALWEAAAGWREQLAGPPLVAENVYAWLRP